MDRKNDLWLRLRNYRFDHLSPPQLLDRVQAAFGGSDASTRAFADKLRRKLGWSRHFALRAIDEYRKYVYLGMISDFPVTPPKVIDQVWHEHLLFTRGYREFCAEVLRRDFDHHPELVPIDEQTAAFQAQYLATCELYRTEFDREPPTEFWGVPKFAGMPDPEDERTLRRKKEDTLLASRYGDTPLYAWFSDAGAANDHASTSMPEFGGGASGGAGSSGSWSDSTSHSGPGDSGSSGDSGSGSGDGGGGSGGSGCSSSCGGGCGSS